MESLKRRAPIEGKIVGGIDAHFSIGIKQKCTIYGDELGVVSEMYIEDISYSGNNCTEKSFSVTNK